MSATTSASPATHIGLWPGAIATGTYALLLLLIGSFLDTPYKQHGEWRVTAGAHGLVELPVSFAFVVVGVAIVFGVVVRRGLPQPAQRTALRALIVAVIGIAAVLVFWTGLPVVLAGGVAVLALDARARLRHFPTTAVIAIGIAILLVTVATWLAFTG